MNFVRTGQREVSGVSFATRPELTRMLGSSGKNDTLAKSMWEWSTMPRDHAHRSYDYLPESEQKFASN